MSLVTISHKGLSATIATAGAELQGLVLDGFEYLWQGDGHWWSGRSPILFPIVGRLHEDQEKERMDSL